MTLFNNPINLINNYLYTQHFTPLYFFNSNTMNIILICIYITSILKLTPYKLNILDFPCEVLFDLIIIFSIQL